MKILFLHGLDSKPFQDRIDILSKYGSLDMPLIDYRNQPNIFNTYLEKVKETHYDVIIGHSLGGCLAFHLCNQLPNTECLLFMPSFKSNNEKLLAIPDIIDTTLVPNDLMVIVSTKDKVVNNDKTYDMIPTDDIIEIDDVEGDNGHSLSPTVLEKWFKVFIGIHEGIVTNIQAFRYITEKLQNSNEVTLKQNFKLANLYDFHVIYKNKLIGSCEILDEKTEIKFVYLTILPEFQNQGFGKTVVQQILKTKPLVKLVTADCMSQQSFMLFYKIYNRFPDECYLLKDNSQLTTLEETLRNLPKITKMGGLHILDTEDDQGVHIKYNI